jgi:UDP-N-acetylglucosamine 2-epimerase
VKVMTVVGTRPELIRLSRVIARLDEFFDHVLVHTGQNFDYELNQVFFDELGIRPPDHYLDAAGGTAAETIARVIERVDKVLASLEPDALLILGDTNSGLSVIPAKRRHIPIFHMEAGNRCFDFRVPEEINRKIIDHLSDINLTYTEHARRNLLAEGLPTEQIFVTGSPQTEVLAHYQKQIEASDILKTLDLKKDRYFVASFHREENVDNPERLSALVESINALAATYDKPVILSVHPRTKQKLDALQVNLDERVRDLKPLGFFDYVQLQRLSYCTLSDSGTITEESAVMGFPAVTLRDTHERPEGMDAGVLVMTGISVGAVLQGVAMAKRQFEEGAKPAVPLDYQPTDVSWKVAKLIQSYVPYVRRRTWGEGS